MSILYRLNAVAIALLFCFVTLAQKKALPGYYITVQGDTMKGIFPSYAQWNKSPGKVEFIVAGTTKSIELTPENSRKFVVDGYDEYISYTGLRLLNPIDNTTMINDRVTMGPNDSSETVVIFLRLVTRTTGGDLYVLNDAKRMNLFYQLPGQMPEELKFKKTFNQNQIKEIDIYRQQLNDLFGNLIIQKNMTPSLEKLDYTEKDLMTFFLSLFPTAGPARNEHRAASKWVVSIGGALNMFKVQADKSFTAVPKTYSSSFSPVASIGFMAALDRNFGKYFLYPNISLFRYKNTGEENTGTFNSSYTYQADLIGIIALNGGINLTNEENFQFFSECRSWHDGAGQRQTGETIV